MLLGTLVPSMLVVGKEQGGERCWSGSSELLTGARTRDRYAGSGSGQGRLKSVAHGCWEVGDVRRISAESTMGALWIFYKASEKGCSRIACQTCAYPHGDLARIKMVGALGKECNPRCYEKCLLCVPK